MHWHIPMGRIYQTYADELFSVASGALGEVMHSPQMLIDLDGIDFDLNVFVAATEIQRRARGIAARRRAAETRSAATAPAIV